MECRELEPLARGLEGLDGEPAHPVVSNAPHRPVLVVPADN